MKQYSSILFLFCIVFVSCGVQKLSEKDCSERKTLKVYVIPFRLEQYDFDTYLEIEEDLYKMCYSVVTVSKTLSGNVIPKEIVYKRIKDSLNIDIYNDWRKLTIDDIKDIGSLINVDYIVTGTCKAKSAYQATEFFASTTFISSIVNFL
jgi:hypothetical protein